MKPKDKVAFFFGAGSSVPFALPTMKQFIDLLKKDIKEKLKCGENAPLLFLSEIIRKKPDLNMEELMEIVHRVSELNYSGILLAFNDPRVHKFIENDSLKASEAETFLKSEIYKIYNHPKSYKEIAKVFKPLFDHFDEQITDVFTTNYDLLLDTYLIKRYKDNFSDGFSRNRWSGFKRNSKKKLIKLHGSLNWMRIIDTGEIEKLTTPLSGPSTNQNVSLESLQYPFRKTFTTVQPFFSIFERFDKVLATNNVIIAIGYNFGDELITEIIKMKLHKREDKLILYILDPNAKAIKERVFKEFENVFEIEFTLSAKIKRKEIEAIFDKEKNEIREAFRKARWYYGRKKYNESVEWFSRTIELDPDFPEAYYRRGIAKYYLGNYEEAIADYDEAIRLKPDFAMAFYNRGNAKDNLKDYKGAINEYNRAIELKPDYADAFYNRGIVKDNLKDYKGALKDYTKAIGLYGEDNPEAADAFYNRGVSKRKLKDYEGAIADYDEAIRLKPDYTNTIQNRENARREPGEENKSKSDGE